MFQIAIDTGGTFTDAVLTDKDRSISISKYPTDTQHPEESIMACIALLAQERKLTEQQLLDNVTSLVVGTTFATNCVLEGNGAKCCLLHNKGFRDIFELQHNIIGQVDIYNPRVAPPRALIPRSLRWGIEERTIFNGEIITPLNEEDVRSAIKKAKKQGVEVPVIFFLHSYANPQNEERAA